MAREKYSFLPAACSRDIVDRARQPRRPEIYPGCGHSFAECAQAADRDLLDWIHGLVFQKTTIRRADRQRLSRL